MISTESPEVYFVCGFIIVICACHVLKAEIHLHRISSGNAAQSVSIKSIKQLKPFIRKSMFIVRII